MAGYANVPPMIGAVVNSRLATLHELETVYGLEDLCNLYEIIIIKVANEQKMYDEAQKNRKGRR
ncbi:MAG: hypothetical protein J6S85_02865 [Methanobrevibacter sp.]|nr:hypothetical protein [Methanobrevibacter sp.]